ncbi:hypothetical protein BC938DRAFT_481158, partial [Jimgerdemannia flammicorona]
MGGSKLASSKEGLKRICGKLSQSDEVGLIKFSGGVEVTKFEITRIRCYLERHIEMGEAIFTRLYFAKRKCTDLGQDRGASKQKCTLLALALDFEFAEMQGCRGEWVDGNVDGLSRVKVDGYSVEKGCLFERASEDQVREQEMCVIAFLETDRQSGLSFVVDQLIEGL